ncbi:MAG: CPBP family intramembrane metalloprotease [Clostridia bacterium]|nr:CPBP family intramembrane metalloprotease [Clostridia bacterium]
MTQRTRTRATLLTLLGLVALQVPLVAGLLWLLPDAAVSPEMYYLASALLTVVMYGLPGWLLKPAWQDAPERPGRSGGWLVLAAVVALLARMVVTPLNAWWAEATGAEVSLLPQADGPVGIALQLLAVVVLPACAEELFFRGALLTNLLRVGSRWQALALTTVMFALMHGSLAGLPGHLIISLLLTLVMMHSGRLHAPVLAHMLFNLLALLRWEAGPVLPWIAGALLLALLIWLLVRLPRGKARRLPLVEGVLCAVIIVAMALRYLK